MNVTIKQGKNDLLRLGKYMLKHWVYYERNISKITESEKGHALTLFQSLKELSADELTILAEKYYKVDVLYNYNARLNVCMTVKPKEIKLIASKLNLTQNYAAKQVKYLEYHVGELFTKHKETAERQLKVSNIHKTKALTLAPFIDVYEIEILSQAFEKIEVYRSGI